MSCLYCSIFPIYGEDVCLKKSACVCEFSNGTGIDLSSASKSTFFSAQTFEVAPATNAIELSTYYYHPCYDILLKPNSTTVNNTCTVPTAICRHREVLHAVDGTPDTYKKDLNVYDLIGNTDKSVFSAKGDAVVYTHGPSNTTVLLICSLSDGELQIFSLAEPNNLVLAFYSQSACLKQIDSGRSVGSTLLIIFFSFVVFYLVLGVCTKKFLMGATGVEVIPNLGFWTDLPNLVKDGWAFMLSGFKLPARSAGPTLSPDPNSYDSI